MDLERTPLNSLDEGKRRKPQKGQKRAKKSGKRKKRPPMSKTNRIKMSRRMLRIGRKLSIARSKPSTQRAINKSHLANLRSNRVTAVTGQVQSRSRAVQTNKKANLLRQRAGTGSFSRRRRRADAPDFATRVEMYEELVNYLQECRANS